MPWFDRIRRLIRTPNPPERIAFDPKTDAYWQRLDAETRHARAEVDRVQRETFPVSVLFPPLERTDDGRTTDTER